MSETQRSKTSPCDGEDLNEKHTNMEEESENVNMNLQRYSRSSLYALRGHERSQRRPECANRGELQNLGFWKFAPNSCNASEANSYTGGTGIGNGIDELANVSQNEIVTGAFSSNTRGNGGQRERQIGLRDRQIGYSSSSSSSRGIRSKFIRVNTAPPIETSFIDQRSSSIAHLLPAFAKKRIAAAAAQNPNNQSPSADQVSVENLTTRQENDSQRQGGYEPPFHRSVRGKELYYDNQKRGLVDSTDYMSSPHRRNHNEHERGSDSGIGGGVNTRHSNSSFYERRIGSGRLLPRDVDWEYHEKNSPGSNQRNSSSRFSERIPSGAAGSSFHEKNSFDRRNSGSSTGNENLNTHHSGGGSGRRYNENESVRPPHHRHSFKDRNDEPEWFSGGPTSQNDIIELRGFDEPTEEDEEENDRNSQQNQIRTRKLSAEEDGGGSNAAAELSQSSSNFDILSPNPSSRTEAHQTHHIVDTPLTAACSGDENKDAINSNENENEPNDRMIKRDMSKEFNFDAFLNLDSLDSEIMQPNSNDLHKDASGGSRFSRWFTNSQDQETIPDDKGPEIPPTPKASNVLEFFQNAKVGSSDTQRFEMQSVEELEAKMRKVDIQDQNQANAAGTVIDSNNFMTKPENGGLQQQQQKDRPASPDMEAFKKLLQQLNNAGGGGKKDAVLEHDLVSRIASPARQPPAGMFPMTAAGIVNQLTDMPQMVPPPPSMMPMHSMHGNPDDAVRPAHNQQLHQPPRQFPPISPSHQTEMNPNNKPLFMNDNFVDQQKRRDFVNLLHAVTRGQIPLAFLEKELNNPNIPTQTKEVITAVIRETSRSITPSLHMLNSQSQMPSAVQFMRRSPINHQQGGGGGGFSSPTPMTMMAAPTHLPSNHMLVQHINPGEQFAAARKSPIGASAMPAINQNTHARHPLPPQVMMQKEMMRKKNEEQQQQQQQESKRPQIDNSQAQGELLQSPQHQTHNSQIAGLAGQTRHLNSPTPLAFTPTSVLRKMTAEKDTTNVQMQQQPPPPQHLHKVLPPHPHMQNKSLNHDIFLNHNQQQQQLPPSAMPPQPRMILGGNHASSQIGSGQQAAPPPFVQQISQPISPQTLQSLPPNLQQQQHRIMANDPKWQMNLMGGQQIGGGVPSNKPLGRPILKGPTPSITMPMPMQQQNQQHQQPMKIIGGHLQQNALVAQQQQQQNPQVPSMMQQHRLKNNQTPQHILNSQPSPQQGLVVPPPVHLQQPVPQNVLQMQQQQQQQHHHQHQQMFQLHQMSLQQQQHMQLQRQLHQQMHAQPPTVHAQQQQLRENSNLLVNFTQPQPQHTVTNSVNNVNSTSAASQREGGGGLSPTSNQLAQWFSPELLAQASAGKLPQINLNQALSLEEFERNIQHSSTVVHN